MAELHLDHPDEWEWWPGHGPKPVLGDCPHQECDHQSSRIICEGPDWEHYELHECRDCQCRGWLAVSPLANRWWHSLIEWKQVAAEEVVS